MQRDRQANGNRPANQGRVPTVVGQGEAEDGVAPPHVDVGGDEGGGLGDHRRNGGSHHAPMERGHEQQIQRNVQHRGDQQEVQRGRAVAHRPQYGREDVVAVLEYQPEGVDAEVLHREVEVALRHADQMGKRRPRHGKPQRREHHAQRHQEQYARRGVFTHLRHVPRAVVLGDDHAVAGGEAHGDGEEEEGEAARRADGRERRLPGEIADDDGVRGVVELLEQGTQQHGEREPDDVLPGRACRHGNLIHGRPLFGAD